MKQVDELFENGSLYASTFYDYDSRGNLTFVNQGVQQRQFVYDSLSRLREAYNPEQVNGSGVKIATAYQYDDASNLTLKTNPNQTTVAFTYDGLNRAKTKTLSTGGVWNYTYDVGAMTTDHLGSTRVVTDSSGAVKARYDYLPFGEEIPTNKRPVGIGYGGGDSTRQKFTQKERDSESGLDYFLARYYSSAQGRFTSVDPAMTSARAIQPQSWNRYSYTANNPLKYTDPTGLDWWYNTNDSVAKPTWFPSDPGGSWKRWSDTYSYIYQPVDAGGLWLALDPNSPNAFLTDTEERAQEWAGNGPFAATPADRDWLAGFSEGSSPLGPVVGYFNDLAGADTTSREYVGGSNTGALAAAIIGGGVGIIRGLTATSRSVHLAERALARGATEVNVTSAEEAAEVYLRNYHGSGYTNTTGMTGNEVRNDKFLFPGGKNGTYHWDLADTQHGGTPHLQVHTHDGKIVRIFFPVGSGN